MHPDLRLPQEALGGNKARVELHQDVPECRRVMRRPGLVQTRHCRPDLAAVHSHLCVFLPSAPPLSIRPSFSSPPMLFSRLVVRQSSTTQKSPKCENRRKKNFQRKLKKFSPFFSRFSVFWISDVSFSSREEWKKDDYTPSQRRPGRQHSSKKRTNRTIACRTRRVCSTWGRSRTTGTWR